jgi:hypothetical protein
MKFEDFMTIIILLRVRTVKENGGGTLCMHCLGPSVYAYRYNILTRKPMRHTACHISRIWNIEVYVLHSLAKISVSFVAGGASSWVACPSLLNMQFKR